MHRIPAVARRMGQTDAPNTFFHAARPGLIADAYWPKRAGRQPAFQPCLGGHLFLFMNGMSQREHAADLNTRTSRPPLSRQKGPRLGEGPRRSRRGPY